jgi:hypothetical protein
MGVQDRIGERFWQLVAGAQAMRGMSDQVLADRLGMDRATLSRKKSATRATSTRDMSAVVGVLPEVRVMLLLDVEPTIANRQYLSPLDGTDQGERQPA